MHSSNICYIKLFHGRKSPDTSLGDWGFEGPIIGPVGVSWTYGNVKIHSPDWEEFEFLPTDNDLIAYEGSFYGDFELLIDGDRTFNLLRSEHSRIVAYPEFKKTLAAAAAKAAKKRRRRPR